MASLYESPRLAAGYAFDRPPVHREIIQRMQARLRRSFRCALDIGCGAGLSTAALASLTDFAVGIEPIETMLVHRAAVAATAHFAAARAEHLPFADSSFDLLTAAGALNYADRELFFPEAVRVLTGDGVLVIYDFSVGRRLRDDAHLDEWFAAFQRRYPPPPGYAMDVQRLPYARFGLCLQAYEAFEVAMPMTLESYLRYAMSETSVAQAIADGVAETEISDWCRVSLSAIFEHNSREVLFDAYIATITKERPL
jgi:ubiquinone/menaquinone biosynthesis C-methylase UbiE